MLVAGTLALATCWCPGQALQSVVQMATNESAARDQRAKFSYTADERSTRTANHLWRERVMETDLGVLRRLIAIDGRALTPAEAEQEDRRLSDIAAHPDALRRLGESQHEDERHVTQLLAMLPKAFVITPDGTRGSCAQFSFHPDPSFHPSTYEERVVHAMVGTVSIHGPENRLCTLDARIAQPVEFGFGLLGRVNSGGHFYLERERILADQWKTTRISVHVDGRVVMLKNLSRDQEVVRGDMQLAPPHISLEDAIRALGR